jgi:translation initiation factor 2D
MIPGGQSVFLPSPSFPTDVPFAKQVITSPPALQPNQLVSVTQYSQSPSSTSKVDTPLAVGQMAVHSDSMKEDGKKGKAVNVLHTWKDCLWDLGRGGEPEGVGDVVGEGDGVEEGKATPPPASESDGATPPPDATLSPQGLYLAHPVLHLSLS